MPPKRNQRRAITPPSPSTIQNQANFHSSGLENQTSDHPSASSSKVNLSDLHPKPCHCCGREITPRSKWKKNWEEIRFCSDQCKSWPGKIKLFTYQGGGGEIEVIDGEVRLKEDQKLERPTALKNDSNLERCIDQDTGNNPLPESNSNEQEVPKYELLIHELDLDAWIEISIWSVAIQSSKPNLKTLKDVAEMMDDDMDNITDIQLANAIQEYIKHSHVGLREMIRRAARRLLIFEPESWACTKRGLMESGKDDKLSLTQNKGRKKLLTLHDVSFAKNEIEISIDKE